MTQAPPFEQIYRDYYRKILNYIYKKISSYQDAEDLTQEILAACYRNWANYDAAKASVSTWIFVIANNRLKNYYRDRKLMDSLDDEENPIELSSHDFMEEAMIFEENKAALYEAIRILEETDRQIVMQKYFHNRTSNEIAYILHIKPGNVRVRLSRALDKMRNYLKQQGYTE